MLNGLSVRAAVPVGFPDIYDDLYFENYLFEMYSILWFFMHKSVLTEST